jgi:predicted Zn-dependent protease
MNIKDRPDDFSKEESFVYVGDPHELVVDRKTWEERTTSLSGVFRRYPEIQESQVSFTAVGGTQRFLNSEGFRHRYGDYLFGITMDGSAQAEDGMGISHAATLWVKRLEDIPPQEELIEKTVKVADKITMMASAALGEEYAGPVLFEGGAAAGFFGDLFLQNVTDPREPLMGGSGDRLTKKVGRKVMAEFLDVVDDPTCPEHDGKLLIGTMVVDDDGVQPQKIQLVEAGILKTVPMSRIPTRQVVGSNGHARGAMWSSPVGSPTNVFITSREGVPEDELKQKMMEICKENDLEYGLRVKTLGAGPGYLGTPGIAFKVYAEDGREEPVRGLVFSGVELRALRDIVAAGKDVKGHNILFKDEMPVSVICPSVLVEEMDLKKVPPQMEKRPYLPRPAFEEE